VGAVPPRQVTSHDATPLHWTWHGPSHSTAQVVTCVHETTLPGPTRTPQTLTSAHSYWQRAPQIAPHEVLL